MAAGARGATDADVVVVGAGLSGLAAARALARAGVSSIVLEARDRVGGRTLNEPIGDGKVVEVGGQWVGPTQDRMYALAREVRVDTFPTYDTGDTVLELDGETARYGGRIPKLGPVAIGDYLQASTRVNRMARQVPLDAPWRAPRAEAWDSQTVWSWMRRNVRTRAGRAMMQLVIEAVWAADAADLSLLHFLFYIHAAGGLDPLVDTGGGAQQDRFVGGSQLVSIRLAEQLGESMVLGAPVRRIASDASGVTAHTDRREVRAARAIVALPPVLASRIEYEPALPAARDQLAQRMPMGAVIKCMAIYDEPFWRADGLSGQATSDTGPVKISFDNSPPDGTPGVLLGFFEGRQARDWSRCTPDERRTAALRSFARYFGPRAGEAERYVERVWADDPWSRGCYAGYMTPGAWSSHGPALREPVGRLHWASTETATVWCGYMDGAISAGERAAQEALRALGGAEPSEAREAPAPATAG
jgi:monoamine oxidase